MKTAVLGLDALPYWYIDKLRDWGQTPHLNSILEKAARLESIPPITAASWPSIMTGVNPGKHGIFSFFRIDKNTRKQRLFTALDLEHPRIHEMLSFNRIRTLAVNPVPTYPLIPVKYARIISNILFTPKPVSSPHGLHEKYFANVEFKEYTTNVIKFNLAYTEALRGLIEEEVDNNELAWIILHFPDAVFHKHPSLLENPSYTSQIWHNIDKLVKFLLNNYENIFIVSDHGFRFFNYKVSVNDILYRHGYAKPASIDKEYNLIEMKARQEGEAIIKFKLPASLYKLLSQLGLEIYARKLYYSYLVRIVKAVSGKTLILRAGAPVDYENSKAVMPADGTYGVYIFDKSVAEDEIINILKNYRGLLVWSAKEVYKGPYIDRGPDVVVVGDNNAGYTLAPMRIFGSVYIKTRYNNHDLWGVLAARTAAGIEEELAGETLPNHVVAPLVMCLMGQPVPAQADSLDYVRRVCPQRVETRDYTGRFRIVKKLALARRQNS